MLTKEKEDNLCVCCKSSRQVYFDLLGAVDRLDRHLMDKRQVRWFGAFKQGLITALNRFEVMAGSYCKGEKEGKRNQK